MRASYITTAKQTILDTCGNISDIVAIFAENHKHIPYDYCEDYVRMSVELLQQQGKIDYCKLTDGVSLC